MAIDVQDVASTVTTSLDPPFWFYRKSAGKKQPSKLSRFNSFQIQSSHFKLRIQKLRRL